MNQCRGGDGRRSADSSVPLGRESSLVVCALVSNTARSKPLTGWLNGGNYSEAFANGDGCVLPCGDTLPWSRIVRPDSPSTSISRECVLSSPAIRVTGHGTNPYFTHDESPRIASFPLEPGGSIGIRLEIRVPCSQYWTRACAPHSCEKNCRNRRVNPRMNRLIR